MELEEVLNGYTFDYESGSSNSYLVVKSKNNVLYKNYQVEMIASNSISGILPLEVRQKNNITGLYYNITSKITLSQYISHKKLNRNEFINLLANIIRILLDSKKYLLSDNSFIINEDYLYINPSSQEVFLMYLPAGVSCSLSENMKRFTLRILVEKAKFDETSNDNFLQRILEYIREDSFTISGFYTFLNTLLTQPKINKSTVSETVIKDELPQKPKQEERNVTLNSTRQKVKKTLDKTLNIPEIAVKESKTIKKTEKAITKVSAKESQSNPVILAILIQVLVIILFFLGESYLLSITGDPVAAYGGTGLILLALDILVMRRFFDKKDVSDKPLNVSKRSIVSDINIPAIKEKVMGSVQESSSLKKGFSDINVISAAVNMDKNNMDAKNPSIDSVLNGIDETAVLCEKMPENPYLSYKHDGVEEKINITKNSFIIGRLQGQADYISANNAVGKIHAEILTRENMYIFKDLNSRNGSFLNGEQVIPNKENEIKSGDRISIANSDFTFFAPVRIND